MCEGEEPGKLKSGLNESKSPTVDCTQVNACVLRLSFAECGKEKGSRRERKRAKERERRDKKKCRSSAVLTLGQSEMNTNKQTEDNSRARL